MLTKHKFFLKVLLIVLAFFIILNLAVGKTAFFAGENLFSFDYLGHVSNNLSYWPGANLAGCKGCPAFYHVSLWYIAVVMAFLSIGQVLHFNPFVFDLLTLVAVQILAFYYLSTKLSPKFNRFAFVIASIVFIALPHNIYILSSATKDGIIHGILTIFFVMAWLTYKQIGSFNQKQLLIRSAILGLILSSSLNIAIAHFPIFLYGYLTIILIALFKEYRYWPRIITVLAVTGSVPLLVNFPLVLSFIKDSHVHVLAGFRALSVADSLSAGAVISGSNIELAKVFFIVIFYLLLVSSIKFSKKILLVCLYLICAYILTGMPIGKTNLYGFLFNFAPFFNHLRALYRLVYFEILLIAIVVYLGLGTLAGNHKKILIAVSLVLVMYPVSYLIANPNLFHSAQVPQEYFQAAEYLKKLPDKKIYFPAYWSNSSPSMTDNYSWLSEKASQPTLYTNPFTSLFVLPNLVHFENSTLSPQQSELKSLLEYSQDPRQIIEALEYAGIKYLILDRNYFWSKNFPYLNLDKMVSGLRQEKRFGNLIVYSLEDKSQNCLPSYGDFQLGYCYNLEHPVLLFNKTQTDVLLHKLTLAHPEYLLAKRKDAPVSNNITDVATQDLIIKKKILIPSSEIFTIDGPISKVFSKKVSAGNYKLFTPILKMSKSNRIFRNPILIVKTDNNIISELTPYSAYEGVIWEETDIHASASSLISLSTLGNGFVIVGSPLLIPESNWADLMKDLDQKPSLPPTLKINGAAINNSDLFEHIVDIDLLDQGNMSGAVGLLKDTTLVQGFPAYTNLGPASLNFNISSAAAFNSATVTVGSAYLNAESDGLFLVKSKDGTVLFKDSISTHGDFIRDIVIPKSALSGQKDLNLSILISKPRILLYRLVLRAGLSD